MIHFIIVTIVVILLIVDKHVERKNKFFRIVSLALILLAALSFYEAWINPVRVYNEKAPYGSLSVSDDDRNFFLVKHPVVNIIDFKQKGMVGSFTSEDYSFNGKKVIFNRKLSGKSKEPFLLLYEGRHF